MKCPKCDYIQDDNKKECLSCGVIFSKIYKNKPIASYSYLDLKKIQTIRDLNTELNNKNKILKNIYKSINIGLEDLPINSKISESEKIYYLKLLKNKLLNTTTKKKFNINILLAAFVLVIIGFIYFLL